MEKSSDGCLCKVCDLKGCKGCPRAKAEEGVMRLKKIKQSASVDKIQKIMYKTEDDYELWLKEVIIELRENHEEDGAENISDDSLKAFNQGQENGYLAALNDIENKS